MKRAAVGVLITTVVVASGACATIAKGTKQTITVTSNVDSAEVLIDGLRVGTTPFVGVVPKNKNLLMIQKSGYQTGTVALSKTLEPIFWGNIIIGGTLGSITDFATGAAYSYAPATYQVDLKAVGQENSEFEQEVKLRAFAMIYIDDIARDLGRGTGDHLGALLSLLNSKRAGAVDAATVREALTASRGDPVRFGRRIVALQ